MNEILISSVISSSIAILKAVVGSLIGYFKSMSIFNRQVDERKKEKKREKLEEALKEIKKIRTFVKHVILNHVRIIEGLNVTKPPYLEEAPAEQVGILLSQYGEFKEEINDLFCKWNEFILKNKEILQLISIKDFDEIASMADDSKIELLSICNSLESKISTMLEQESI